MGELMILWLVFASIVGWAASQRKRSVVLYVCASFFLTPIVALILLAVSGACAPLIITPTPEPALADRLAAFRKTHGGN